MPSQRQEPSWTRYAGMGFEFASVLIACTLVGYWVDYHWQIQNHWGVLVGTFIGVVGGGYNFIREALQAVREVSRRPGGERRKHPLSGREDRPSRDVDEDADQAGPTEPQ
ncbi:MAG TPA: AtpZ/AtpI family protein [Tepidisphaeraceae bacterium]|nr:AtpZ/AtpI family protein [Tepidisphaeraceae bacterium]